MEDGTESPENSKTKNLLKLVADLLEFNDLTENEVRIELIKDKHF